MIKSDSHDSGVEYHSQNEQLIKEDAVTRARRARRQMRRNSATTSGDDTKREVSEAHLQAPPKRASKSRSPSHSDRPPVHDSTTVTVENEVKPRRKKKTFKEPEGEGIEMTVRKRSGSRQRSRQPKPSKAGPSESDITRSQRSNKILGITVHRTDRLKMDLRLRHPFVRVHLIDINTKSYVRKSDPSRAVFRFHGQEEQSTDFIRCFETDPYDFNTHRSTVPSWEQDLIINDEYALFTTVGQQDIYAFFEILDFIDLPQNPNDRSRAFSISWAYLKIVGAQNTLNTEKIVRLQLWEPLEMYRSANSAIPDVVNWYTQRRNQKYPSTIYVTIRPIDPPGTFHAGLRSALASGVEQIRAEYENIKAELHDGNPIDAGLQLTDRSYVDINMGGLKPLERVERLPKPWQKFPNSKCKVPSEFLFALNSGERGCSSIRFSHNGFFLACAEVNKAQENHRITIFEMPGGQRLNSFDGHLQMIYELDWSRSDRYLVSASADSSVKIWNFENVEKKPWRTLAHPSYVYCARFHPIVEEYVVTAGYDKIIRVWSIQKKHGTIITTMADHLGFISSLAFNLDGTRLVSVDSVGAIKIWNGLHSESAESKEFFDSWSFKSNFDFPELKDIPLNSVTYAPRDHYLLISARQNMILLIDIQTKSISRRYMGAFNTQDRIHSTFSPCGSYVFSGSEDRRVYCWETYSGHLIYSYDSLNYTQTVLDIQFHPLDNIIAMSGIGASHQIYVFYHMLSDPDAEAKPFRESLVNRSPVKTSIPVATSTLLSDTEHKPPVAASTTVERTAREFRAPRKERTFSGGPTDNSADESSTNATPKLDSRNRRLAVVNKILDDMDELINAKSSRSRQGDAIGGFGGGNIMSRSTERDVSPYQGRRSIPSSGYNSDSGRPPLVSPLRGLTSPDLFVPASNRTDDDDYIPEKGPSSTSNSSLPNPIMYGIMNYKAQKPGELSFKKNDPIKVLKKESALLWYGEHQPTGERGYISPNRIYANPKGSYPQSEDKEKFDDHSYSIREIPRLQSGRRRPVQKSVTFDPSE